MKKSSFVAMIMGTLGGILTSIGLCMCLIAEWNAFMPGVIMASLGFIIILAMLKIWRKMEGKAPVHISQKTILTMLVGIIGTILFGSGMCLTMVWNNMVLGISVGVVGIVVLLSLIPMVKGLV